MRTRAAPLFRRNNGGVQSSFRGELREYRDRSAEYLKKLRQQIETASAAMTLFANAVVINGDDHENAIRAELRALESTSKQNSIEEIRQGITAAVAAIEASVEQIHRTNQLMVAQLQDEIRTLHLQNEQERSAFFTDLRFRSLERARKSIPRSTISCVRIIPSACCSSASATSSASGN